jgi:hypothetical protein
MTRILDIPEQCHVDRKSLVVRESKGPHYCHGWGSSVLGVMMCWCSKGGMVMMRRSTDCMCVVSKSASCEKLLFAEIVDSRGGEYKNACY